MENKHRLTIGMLSNELDGWYTSRLWRGVNQCAEENDVNLLLFVDSFFRTSHLSNNIHHMIYNAANPDKLDGLIITPGVADKYVKTDKLRLFLEPFSIMPIISILYPIEGITTVYLENKDSMNKVVNHLIEQHGCRKIAFIKGPVDEPEALDRLQGYLEALEAHHIRINEELIIPGSFFPESGKAAAIELLQKRNIKIDAIVAANDDMAIGAYQAIRKMGIGVPEDIALAGFDNIDHTLTPIQLTTVNNPVFEIGKKAAESILKMINKEEVPEKIYLPAEPIIRQSCGCNFENRSELKKNTSIPVISIKYNKKYQIEQIISQLIYPDKYRDFYEKPFRNLIDAFYKELEEESVSGNFLKLAEDTIKQIDNTTESLDLWNENFSIIVNTLLEITKDHKNHFTAELLLNKVQLMIQNSIINIERQEKFYTEQAKSKLLSVLNFISPSITTHQLMLVIEESLPSFGIKSCYITKFLPEEKSKNTILNYKLPSKSILLLGFNENLNFNQILQTNSFLTGEIIPNDLLPVYRRFTLIIMPLLKQNEIIGLFIPELGDKDDFIYGFLQEQINNSLLNCELFQQVKQSEYQLNNTIQEANDRLLKFHDLAMYLPIIIIETNLNLEITFLNQMGFQFLGFENDVLDKNTSLYEFVQPNDQDNLKEKCRAIIYGKLPDLADIQLINKKGNKITFISKASLVITDNNITGIRWSGIDLKALLTTAFSPENSFFENYKFSSREKEIIQLILQGFKNKDVANKLAISERAVKYHLSNIYSKMNISNKTEFYNLIKKFNDEQHGPSSFIFSSLSRMLK